MARKPFDPLTLTGEQAAALSRLMRETATLSLPPGKSAAIAEALALLWPAVYETEMPR